MGNGLEDGTHTFSVLFNYFTLPLPSIVSRFAFLPPRFPFSLGASLIIIVKLTQYTTVLPRKAAIRQIL